MRKQVLKVAALMLLTVFGLTSMAQNIVENGSFDVAITDSVTVDTLTKEYTAGDLTMYAFRFPPKDLVCDAMMEIDESGHLTGDNSAKITIEHSGWVSGYVALKKYITDLEPGMYDLSFEFDAVTGTHIGPSIETGHGDGYAEPVLLEQTEVNGKGTYSTKFEIYQAMDSATLNIRLGTLNASATDGSWKYGSGYNSGKTIWLDEITLQKSADMPPMADKNLIENSQIEDIISEVIDGDSVTQQYTTGDLTLYAFRFAPKDLNCNATLERDFSSRLSGPVSAKVEIENSGWVPGYVAVKKYMTDVKAGTYYFSFMYDTNDDYMLDNHAISDSVLIAPSIETGHGDGYAEPLWIDTTTVAVAGMGVYTTSFEIYQDQDSVTLSLRMGTVDSGASDGSWKYGPGYNAGKTIWLDSLVLSMEPSIYSPSDVVFTVLTGDASVEGAEVELAGMKATTDADGMATVAGVAPGTDIAYTVTSGDVVSEGTVTVMGDGVQVDVEVKLDGTSVGDELSNNFKVYPNPSNGIFTIEALEGSNYVIFDLSGKTIVSGVIESQNHEISVQTSGIYVVQVVTESNVLTKRVVVK